MLNPWLGVGLRVPHYYEVLETRPAMGWFEVHPENFFYTQGVHADVLCAIRQYYPLSLHGVGLSLGSADGVCFSHLKKLQALIMKYEPFLISEHLSWSRIGGRYMPDLLPAPYTKESFEIFAQNIEYTQDYLKQPLLIENPSSYFEYKCSEREEIAFLVELCKKTGAKLLLDVNNVYVSCENHGWDPNAYIQSIPVNMVGEIHVAGHSQKEIKIDTHDTFVCTAVWALYAQAIQRFGPTYTLLEWDAKIPTFSVLQEEIYKADVYFA